MKSLLALLLTAPLAAQTVTQQNIVYKVVVNLVQSGTGSSSPVPAPTPTVAPPGSYSCDDVTLSAPQSSIRAGNRDTLQFSATAHNQVVLGGRWDVGPSFAYGGIDQNGLYVAPDAFPSPAISTIYWAFNGCYKNVSISLLNYAPQLTFLEPNVVWQLSTFIQIHGRGFTPDTTVTINGQPTPVTYFDFTRLGITLSLPSPSSQPITITVTNPAPGASSIAGTITTNFPTFTEVTPSMFVGGPNTLTLKGNAITDYSTFTFDGKPLHPTRISDGVYQAQIFVAPWRTGTIPVTVNTIAGAPVSSSQTIPIQSTLIPFDQAARFTTQAAFGPRPDLVQHIQQIGLQAFLAEQLQQPAISYTKPGLFSARSQYMRSTLYSNSLLRLRVATALGSFIVNTADNADYGSYATWESLLENGALGNFRDLMTNVTADARMGFFLNLAGNNVSSDPSVHPNQNYARELMQLFTMGPVQLNDDGTPVLSASGQPVPNYDQNTILDLSRALTGWNNAPPVNPDFTEVGVDWSQPLIPREDLHDHGAKTLFGNVQLPAGQGIIADRTQALDTIFNQQSVPPYVSRILIQHLVKSNPSPTYISHVAGVFRDNGRGVRGDLAAVVTAILLDPEARSGDRAPSPDDGFLQDSFLFQMFAMSALQQDFPDNQPSVTPALLGQNIWYPPSVNGFYSPIALIPGTTITSPEFTLWNNLSLIHRTQLLYGMVSGTLNDFGPDYMTRSWLFQNFTTVPDMVDALDHLLYHGTMPATTRSIITSYCSSLDPSNRQQLITAVFLALNSDTFNVTH